MEFGESDFTVKRFSPPTSEVIPKEPYMKAVTCQESENDYAIQISIHTMDDPKGNSNFHSFSNFVVNKLVLFFL